MKSCCSAVSFSHSTGLQAPISLHQASLEVDGLPVAHGAPHRLCAGSVQCMQTQARELAQKLKRGALWIQDSEFASRAVAAMLIALECKESDRASK